MNTVHGGKFNGSAGNGKGLGGGGRGKVGKSYDGGKGSLANRGKGKGKPSAEPHGVNKVLQTLEKAGVSQHIIDQVKQEQSVKADVQELDYARKVQSAQARLKHAEKRVMELKKEADDAWAHYNAILQNHDELVDKRDELAEELERLTCKERISVGDVSDFVSEMHKTFQKGFQAFDEQQFNVLKELVVGSQQRADVNARAEWARPTQGEAPDVSMGSGRGSVRNGSEQRRSPTPLRRMRPNASERKNRSTSRSPVPRSHSR